MFASLTCLHYYLKWSQQRADPVKTAICMFFTYLCFDENDGVQQKYYISNETSHWSKNSQTTFVLSAFRQFWSCLCAAKAQRAPASWSPFRSTLSTRLRWPNSGRCRSTTIWMKRSAGVWTSASCSGPWTRLGATADPERCASSTLGTPQVTCLCKSCNKRKKKNYNIAAMRNSQLRPVLSGDYKKKI